MATGTRVVSLTLLTTLPVHKAIPVNRRFANSAQAAPTYTRVGVILVRAFNAEFGEFADLAFCFGF
jgi:hypothetical protein